MHVPKLAANLSLLWPELPVLERFDAATAAGFEFVEILFPYDVAVQDMQRAMRQAGQRMILINAPPPNYTGGARGFAARPGGQERFQHDMRRVFRYAEALGVAFVHIMSGEGCGDEAFDTFVDNLKWAARNAPKGVTLTIEPLNDTDMPGYFLNDYSLAARVLDAVKKPNLRLQYDSYHAQVIHGDALQVWRLYGLRAAHVQIGDTPGRIAPGKGEIDFPALWGLLDATGYTGWVSAEYHPGPQATQSTLRWMKSWNKAFRTAS